jgi:hypothetical protein
MNNPFGSTASQAGLTSTPSSQQQQQDDGMAWWFKWLIKIVAVLFGIIGCVLGVFVVISTSAKCFIAGIILMYDKKKQII